MRHAMAGTVGVTIGLAWVALGFGCGKQPPTLQALEPPQVTVMRPVQIKVADQFDDYGQTAAVESVDLRARVSGYLVKKYVPDGAIVRANEPLYEIDPSTYLAALDRTQAEIARWQASLERAQAELARREKLLPSGAVSREDYDLAVTQVRVAEAELKGGQAAVRAAQLDVDFTKIISPIDGRVSKCNFSVGDLIPVGASDPSTVLTTVVSENPIWVYFSVPERVLLQYRDKAKRGEKEFQSEHVKELKLPVYIGLANETGYPHRGIIDFVDSRLDPQTGTIRLRGVFENANDHLIPGLFVRVRLPLSAPQPALLVPEVAILSDQGQKYLLGIDGENTVVRLPVELGAESMLGDPAEPYRVVRTGLPPEQLVIVNGIQDARIGAKVKATTAEPPPSGPPAAAAAAPPPPAATGAGH